MNCLSRLARLLTVVLVAAWVVPASAAQPEKKWSIAAPAAIAASTASQLVTLTIKNETPNGNSSANSLVVNLPTSAGLTTSFDTSYTPTSTWPGQVSVGSNAIAIENMSPLKPLDTFTLTFKMTVSGSACGSLDWTGTAWTGSNKSGDTFRQIAPTATGATSTTAVINGVALSFSGLPTSAVKNIVMPAIQVTATSSCGGTVTSFSGPIVMTSNCTGAGCLAGTTTKNATSGVATFNDLKFTTLGSFTLTATGLGVSKTSSAITVHDGTLSCDGESSTFPSTFVDADGDGATNGVRGTNKDGSPCIVVNYTFIDDIAVNNKTIFSWDTAVQPQAVFKYSAKFLPEFVGSNGLPQGVTKVQWLDTAGNPFPASPVPARACLSSKLPFQYASLVNPVLAGDTQITVNVVGTLPPVPFPIIIEKERMTVTLITGNVWDVSRGTSVGGPAVPPGHATTWKVMSTPFPLDGTVIQQMCIAKETWEPVTAGPADCDVPPGAPNACVQNTTTIIDGGDGVMIRG